MTDMNTLELLEIPGMEPKRVDMILAGAILFEECLQAVGAKAFRVTEFSLRDGIVEEERELARDTDATQVSLHIEEIRDKALKAGAQEVHFEKVRELSLKLFDRLNSLHGIDRRLRGHLEAAALLHDVGEVISPSNHEKHSHYFIKHADFSGMQPWETEYIADLCLHHRGGNPPNVRTRRKKSADRSGKSRSSDEQLQKQAQEAFPALLAILRLADALDRGHRGHAAIKSVRVSPATVTIQLDTRESLDLELLRVEQKKELFERVFGRALVLKLGR
jgi:exopolyphosphatase/guanosine-5'-triphosphate,3'-diphosphate pyrophosphatase